MKNRLASATSPYLLQHADNPVDWHEWGEEAFSLAHSTDRPILLSVGYSACHWCHVMAHESFEDEATAAYMNEHFVNVKVDREERPDVDRIYMDAVQAMTGQGGWPMTVFMTPEGKPFFAGTYYPKDDRPNFPSFRRVLAAMTDAWKAKRNDIEHQAEQLTAAVQRDVAPGTGLPGPETTRAALTTLGRSFDEVNGGFGHAPKFPQAPTLEFLLREAATGASAEAAKMLSLTLDAMARGGIYDHLGGGFSRYSVDAHWLVPHFEKMLYDNALLARLYLRAWQVTGENRFMTVATETIDYMLNDLRLPGGGFAAAEDADSEGEEGKFYVFDHDEILAAAGGATAVAEYFGASESGNFEGANILHEAHPIDEVASRHGMDVADLTTAIAASKGRLLEVRADRVRPGLDDKVVTAWNGLAIRALAEAGAVLDRADLIDAAATTARFVLSNLRRNDDRLLRSWREGSAVIPAFCEDYAAMAIALLALYQATGETSWFVQAKSLADSMIELFEDPDGGFYDTGTDSEQLITRPREMMDNPSPSANSMAAEALFVLADLTGVAAYRAKADSVLVMAGRLLEAYPSAVGHLLAVATSTLTSPKEVAITGSPDDPLTRELLAVLQGRFRPNCVVAWDRGDPDAGDLVPLLAGRAGAPRGPMAYVCRGFSCDAPTADASLLSAQLDGAR